MHSRSGDNLTAHPEAAGIIRQATGFPRFDEFPGPRLALPAVQLDHRHGIWQVEDKAPAPRGRDGTSAQALLALTGNIWPTRNTQREANYAQPACSLRRDSVHPSPLPTGPADTKHQNGRSRGRTPTPEAPAGCQIRRVT